MNPDLAYALRMAGLALLGVGVLGNLFTVSLNSIQATVINLVFLGFGLTILALGMFGLPISLRGEVLFQLPVLLIAVALTIAIIVQIARLTGKQKTAEPGQSTKKTE